MTRAVIVCGARWWGDMSLDPAGRPVDINNPEQRAFHLARAHAEKAGAVDEISRVPDDCIVIHTPERGASMELSMAATRRRLRLMTVPREVVIEVIIAMKTSGWVLKVLAAGSDPEIVDRLRSAGIHVTEVKALHPEPEPAGADEIDPEAPVSE
ncbi:MAG TPA: hypothetical protein VMX12_02035 [Acidimicrobiia bacterium]|nr:hypothetical protein [Acidimicrobiia bacterium]